MKDIKRGHVVLIVFGISGCPEANAISYKYGFREHLMGCVVSYSPKEKEYNDLITEFLDKRNGKDWQVKYNHEIDSLKNLAKE